MARAGWAVVHGSLSQSPGSELRMGHLEGELKVREAVAREVEGVEKSHEGNGRAPHARNLVVVGVQDLVFRQGMCGART